MGSNILETEGLSKKYAGVLRVNDLDIRIKEGEVYGFLGPNGAGKSTTMKMLQTGLFYGYFFFPILIAICAAYLWRLEHMERNWNRIMIFPFSRNKIFIAKLIVLAKAIFVAQLFLMLLVLFVGKILFGFSQPIPLQIFWWLIMGWFSALSVGAVQLYLSMRIRSFAVPIGISVCLCMVGLVFYTLGFGSVFPYSQIVLGLASQSEELPVENLFTLVPFVIFYVVLFVSLATNYLNTKDIKAN